MLPRRLRLSRRAFLPALHPRSAATAHFSASVGVPRATGGAAAIVSKRVARLSTSRHLLKRRMLAVMRQFVSPTATLIVHARAGARALPYPKLKEELTHLLERLLPR